MEQKPPKSPLTTIPIYLSRAAPEADTLESQEDSALCEFLTFLGSAKTMSSLSESNPSASSKGMGFGVVLVNTTEASLGYPKGIIMSSQRDDLFLDSLFLQQDICSEDFKFCLRTTWAELGRQFYYACLRWNVSDQIQLIHSNQLASDDNPDCAKGQDKDLPITSVSFDQDEILALGEYASIDPPLLFGD
ncbi:hypothetical protein N7451_007871 [Penicillium sp. IBT 35674x]|nr:hypothetical protein N7451_007871 [Penicillium sp. IBT 35674x]